jgi:hypothetical protein
MISFRDLPLCVDDSLGQPQTDTYTRNYGACTRSRVSPAGRSAREAKDIPQTAVSKKVAVALLVTGAIEGQNSHALCCKPAGELHRSLVGFDPMAAESTMANGDWVGT